MESIDLLVLSTANDWLEAGQRVLLATVARTWGSSPRPVGSMMALRNDGRVVGSVSGGCIEDDLIHRYTTAYGGNGLPESPPKVVRYGSFVFRTTGFNSIRTLAARLLYFQAISGGRLACIPLELRLRGKSTRQSHRTPIFYVDLTVRSGMDMTEALQKASELDTQRIAVGFDQTALDDAARRGFGNGAFEDSEENSHVVIEEFFGNTEAASTRSQGESLPTTNSLADKLESLASQAN